MEFVKRHWEIPLFILFAVLAVTFPEVDIWVSEQFYEPGAGFPLDHDPVIQFIYVVFRYMPHFIIPIFLLMLAAPWFIKAMHGTRKYTTFLLLSLLIGPGLIVHPILKDNWDRPRPENTQNFGGQHEFAPAFKINDVEGTHKSFASGHAAMGFWFIAFAWVFRKRRLLTAGLIIGAIVSMGRIVQGGHFLSDIITAAFICYFTCQAMSYWLFGDYRIKREKLADHSEDLDD